LRLLGRHFPRIFFNEATTEAGRDPFGWHHQKKSNDDRNIGLGQTMIGVLTPPTVSA